MNETTPPGPAQCGRIYLLRHRDVSYFDKQGRPLRPDTVPLNAAGEVILLLVLVWLFVLPIFGLVRKSGQKVQTKP
jgi:hypothetical protein